MGKMLVLAFDDNEKMIFEDSVQYYHGVLGFQKVTLLDENILSVSSLKINMGQRTVRLNQQDIHLTTKEYNILCLLAINKGRVVTYDRIYESVWGGTPDDSASRVLNYHIRNLCKKFKTELQKPNFTIQCVGKWDIAFWNIIKHKDKQSE